MRRLAAAVALAVLAVLALLSWPTGGFAAPAANGPSVTLSDTRVRPDEFVIVTIDGFTARSVTISVCGNQGLRGSADCNMAASDGLGLDRDGSSTQAQMPLAAPPVPCPCVVRVASSLTDEVATTPVTLVGHPVAPVVAPEALGTPVEIEMLAVPQHDGWASAVRSSLGGPTSYVVTVTVTNRSSVAIDDLSLSGQAVNDGDFLTALELDRPGRLGAGDSFSQQVEVELPAWSFGEVTWSVTVIGPGGPRTVMGDTSSRPTLLVVAIVLLVLDVMVVVTRFLVRRRIVRGGIEA